MTTAPNGDCLFCSIVQGAILSHAIYEDAQTLAFLDINPAADGHTLVVPKQHADDLFDIYTDTVAAVMRTAKLVAGLIDEQLAPDGLTLVQTNRRAGWQDVFHFHMHLVPRWEGDSLTQPWAPRPVAPENLRSVAKILRPAAERTRTSPRCHRGMSASF